MSEHFFTNDIDPIETQDWLQAIESVIHKDGVERVKFLINKIITTAQKNKINIVSNPINRDYINTIPIENEPEYPGNLEIEYKIQSAIRWNAMMIVLNASKKDLELGGHIASFQSIATVYEVCFNHFFLCT